MPIRDEATSGRADGWGSRAPPAGSLRAAAGRAAPAD